ncbi:MAG TPA: hypothetical protein VJN44_14905 [Roseateles sp.]|nr:hypothetical protein [Roseateles sp.]
MKAAIVTVILKARVRASLCLLLAGACWPAVQALELVSAEEAARPEAELSLTRGVTRGPSITQELPAPGKGPVRAPLQLKVAVKARGGARIDLGSLQLTYLKSPMVDLTPRLRAGISETGVAVDGLSLPPGQHRIQLRVADSEGRETETMLQLDVAP